MLHLTSQFCPVPQCWALFISNNRPQVHSFTVIIQEWYHYSMLVYLFPGMFQHARDHTLLVEGSYPSATHIDLQCLILKQPLCLCWFQGLAEDHISHILPHELKRTRLNVLCFMANLPENNSLHASRRGSQSAQRQRVASSNNMSGRKSSGSSLTDSESGRSTGLPPVSPSASDTIRAADRYSRTRNDPKRASYRGQTRYNVDIDELR